MRHVLVGPLSRIISSPRNDPSYIRRQTSRRLNQSFDISEKSSFHIIRRYLREKKERYFNRAKISTSFIQMLDRINVTKCISGINLFRHWNKFISLTLACQSTYAWQSIYNIQQTKRSYAFHYNSLHLHLFIIPFVLLALQFPLSCVLPVFFLTSLFISSMFVSREQTRFHYRTVTGSTFLYTSRKVLQKAASMYIKEEREGGKKRSRRTAIALLTLPAPQIFSYRGKPRENSRVGARTKIATRIKRRKREWLGTRLERKGGGIYRRNSGISMKNANTREGTRDARPPGLL